MKAQGIYVLAALGFVAYGAMNNVDRDSDGNIIGEGDVDAFNIQVGDCFNDSNYDNGVASVPGVPCSDPHDNEAYAVFDVTVAEFPDDDAMSELAYESCLARFEKFVGRDYESSTLEITTLYPSVDSWDQDDREVVCAVYDMETNPLVGSAEGRGL